MKSLQGLVVAVLLGVWCFPAVSLADPLATPSAEVGSRPSSGATPAQPSSQADGQTEEAALAAREKQSQDLQNFRGGSAIYIGGGATLVLLIVLLVILL
jgi:hypothetical protein